MVEGEVSYLECFLIWRIYIVYMEDLINVLMIFAKSKVLIYTSRFI